jgi:hypothetical protein
MAALFGCSGDHIDTASGHQKWQASGIVVPGGKHGRGLRGYWAKSLATIQGTRCIMGMWFRDDALMGPTYFDTTSTIAGVSTRADGSFGYTILDGPLTTYYSDVDLWRPNTWHFLELDVVLSTGSGGWLKVYLDDPTHASPVIDLEDVYTASATYARAPNYWNGCAFKSSNVFDDAYCLDGAASDVYGNTGAPNAPLGPIRIDVVRATGAGLTTEWTPSPAVPNWQNVNDDYPDGATLNTASADGSPNQIGAEDLHEMEDIDTGDTAIFQHLLVSSRKTDEGAGQLTMLARHDGVTYDLETRNLAEDFLYRTRVVLHTMPNGDPLTDANFNAQQLGYRRDA